MFSHSQNGRKNLVHIISKSAYFDKEWYLNENPDVAASKQNPAKHYLKHGWLEERNPGPNFSTHQYLIDHPDCEICPLLYIQTNSSKYKSIATPLTLFDRFLHLFKYLDKTDDYILVARSKYFKKEWYLKMYPEVAIKNLDPVEHYMKIGWTEGKLPGPNFDGNDYLDRYPSVRKLFCSPLLHYEKYGKTENRIVKKTQEDYKMSFRKALLFRITSFLGKFIYYLKYRKNKDAKILVCLHLYYMEAWPLIQKYLKNLDPYNWDLIITYTKGHYDKITIKNIKDFKAGTKFFCYPNKGFDIGPFMDVLSKIDINTYDIIYKIQSKGTHRPFLFMYIIRYSKRRIGFLISLTAY